MTFAIIDLNAGTWTESNVLADFWLEESKYLRRVKRIALYGFDANFDIKYRVQYGNRVIAELYSNGAAEAAAGAAEYMLNVSSKEVCLPSEELSVWLNGTGTAGGFLAIELEEIAPPRRRRWGRGRRGYRRFRRGYRRRRY